MKTPVLVALFLVGSFAATAQINGLSTSNMRLDNPNFAMDYLKDPLSSSIASRYDEVDGSPFLNDQWVLATVVLDSMHIYKNVPIKLNLFENTVHYRDESGKEKRIAGKVQEIKITDSSSTLYNTVYISGGFNEDNDVFFKVLADGKKVALLERMSVRKQEIKVFNAPPKTQFNLDKKIYIYSKGVLYKETKDCSSLSFAFKNDRKAMEFADKNDIRCNRQADLLKLVNYYNAY